MLVLITGISGHNCRKSMTSTNQITSSNPTMDWLKFFRDNPQEINGNLWDEVWIVTMEMIKCGLHPTEGCPVEKKQYCWKDINGAPATPCRLYM